MKKFDDLYDEFEAAVEKLDEGVYSEKNLEKLNSVIGELSAPGGKDADKKAILLAYSYCHLGNGYYFLADFENDFGSEKDCLKHYSDALGSFRKSVELFSAIKKSDDRDYLLADCYQMYADFSRHVCTRSDKYGLDVTEAQIEEYYKKSIDLYEEILNKNEYDTRGALVDVYYNAAGYFYGKYQNDKARPLFERSKSLAEELNEEEPGEYDDVLELIAQYMN